MANQQIATYLNDHLAGSTVALELLEHMKTAHAGTPLETFFGELCDDVTQDRQELESIMSRLQIAQSPLRKAAAWVTEKFSELKLAVEDPAGGALRLLEALEVLSLGIEGKKVLWRALAATAKDAAWLQIADYEKLIKRAEEQRHRVEEVRVQAAKSAFLH
jgi:hypothetical protein